MIIINSQKRIDAIKVLSNWSIEMKTSISMFLLMFVFGMYPTAQANTDKIYFINGGVVDLKFQQSGISGATIEGCGSGASGPLCKANSGFSMTVKDNHISIGGDEAKSYANVFNLNLTDLDGPFGGAIAHQDFVSGMDLRPGGLHFAITGALTINGYSYDIVLGQGYESNIAADNWWLGGRGFTGWPISNSHANSTNTPPGTVNGALLTQDGRFMISVDTNKDDQSQNGSSDSNTFLVTPMSAYPDWMKMIDDSTLLGSITMPGTHDSGTYAWGYALDIYDWQAQDLSILAQLNLGARMIDLRLCMDGSSSPIYICHGTTFFSHMKSEITLDYVLRQVNVFLKNNPSETVVLLFKNEYLEGGATPLDLGNALSQYLVNAGGPLKFWQTNRMPALGEVRGKSVVIVRDNLQDGCFSKNDQIGINVTWLDNTTFASPSSTSCMSATVPFWIQDNYQETNPANKLDYEGIFVGSVPSHLSGFNIGYLTAANLGSIWLVSQPMNSYVAPTVHYWATNKQPMGATMLNFMGTGNNTTSNTGNPSMVDDLISDNKFTVTPKITMTASHDESYGSSTIPSALSARKDIRTRDSYNLKVKWDLSKANLDPRTFVSSFSHAIINIGDKKFHRILDEGSSKFTKFKSSRSGTIIFENKNKSDYVKVAWSKRYLEVSLFTMKPRTDGINLLSMPREQGIKSGSFSLHGGVNWIRTTENVTWKGLSKLNKVTSGAQPLHRWRANN